MAKILSGPSWVTVFPNSSSTDDLTEPFRANVKRFIRALEAAGATVFVDTTLRSKPRAFLMHWSFRVAKENYDPSAVPAMTGVDIDWAHPGPGGRKSLEASRLAALEMVKAYGIVYRPAVTSRHSEGRAIDMTMSWRTPELRIKTGTGTGAVIKLGVKNGNNPELHKVGKTYQVTKLPSDPPHWSIDGH